MSDFRRRLMRAIGKIEEVSPYPPDYVDDGRLWAYATISSAGTYQIADDQHAYWTAVEIDGVTASLDRSQYLTAGDHVMKFTMKTPTILYSILRGRGIYNKIIIPSCVTTLGDYCLRETSAQIVMHKELITHIGTQILFKSTSSIGDIDFPNLVSLTGNSNFNDYRNGAKCKIKNLGRITTLPLQAFRDFYPKDNKYIIPVGVTSVGQLAFYNRGNFTYYCYPLTPPTFGSQVFYGTPTAIYVPTCSLGAYKIASGWSNYASVIYPLDNGMVYFTIEWHDGETDIFELPENSTWADIVANPLYNHGLGKVTGRAYTFCESTLQEGYVGILDEYNNERLLAPDMSTTTGIDPDGALLTESINCGAYYTCVGAKEDIGEDGGEEA